MKAAIERKLIRWIHIIASVPIIGYIYGPVSQIPEAAFMVKAGIVPLVTLSGLWLWKGHWVRKLVGSQPKSNSSSGRRKPEPQSMKRKA